MSDAFPVFVGITGKRVFSDDPATAQALEAKVRERLAAIFDYFDERLPTTPKILLTGAAAGTDLIVAEEALGLRTNGSGGRTRRNWLVVAALPFAESLFQDDFTLDQWKQYRRVVDHPRTRPLILPPLRNEHGRSAEPAELQRHPGASERQSDLRNRHYEQVGIWIADAANVLLAVMPTGEAAAKVGGTARIVALRRSTHPDRVAAEIISASTILAPRSELLREPNGHVWLLDPSAEPLCAAPPITVLPPASDLTAWQSVYDAPGALHWQLQHAGDAHHESKVLQSAHLKESWRVMKIASDFVRDGAGYAPSAAKEPTAPPAWPDAGERTETLLRISASLDGATNAVAKAYRQAIYRLVGYFVLAVLAIETFGKFSPENPYVLAGYLIALALAMLGYLRAGSKDLQPTAEDRRAIHEALRVQGAWWQAGLDDRVDFVYLRGVDQDLARVRAAIRNVIAYALIACKQTTRPANWNALFDPENWPPFAADMPGSKFPPDWIGNQCYYFRMRKEQRRRRGEFLEATSWTLFVTATCLAFLLLLRLASGNINGGLQHLLTRADAALAYWISMLATYLLILATALCWWLDGRLLAESRTNWRRLPLAVAINLPAAFFLFMAAQFAAALVIHKNEALWTFCLLLPPVVGYLVYFGWKIVPDANRTHPFAWILGLAATTLFSLAMLAIAAAFDHRYDHFPPADRTMIVSIYMIIVIIVFLPALGGAVRFLSEKLAVEVEALSYRDAHVWFESATSMLREIRPGHGDADADERAREIIRRLGALALSENESWLKLRRQRPLSPVI
jgi:hypothetical protein